VIDLLIRNVPWQAMPVQLYHSHNVDVVDAEETDRKALRITLFSPVNLSDVAAGMVGQQQGGPQLKDVFKGTAKFEIPFAVSDLKSADFKFSAENMQFRFQTQGEIDRRVLEASKEVLDQMSPQRKWMQQFRVAMAKSLHSLDFTMNFCDLGELVAQVPAWIAPPMAPQQQMIAPGGGARRARLGVQHMGGGYQQRPQGIQAMKIGLEQLWNAPIGAILAQQLLQLPMLAEQMGQGPTYAAVQKNIIGLSKVHLQHNDNITKFTFKGLDFVALLPDVGAHRQGGEAQLGQNF